MMLLSALLATAVTASAAEPDRLITCHFARVANMQAASVAEMGLTGDHLVVVLQPAAAVEGADRPPRDTAAARLVRFHDPDKVLGAGSVDTVLDGWPALLEFVTRLPGGGQSFVTLGKIRPGGEVAEATGSTGLITPDGAGVVGGSFLQGPCRIENRPGLAAVFDRLTGGDRR